MDGVALLVSITWLGGRAVTASLWRWVVVTVCACNDAVGLTQLSPSLLRDF